MLRRIGIEIGRNLPAVNGEQDTFVHAVVVVRVVGEHVAGDRHCDILLARQMCYILRDLSMTEQLQSSSQRVEQVAVVVDFDGWGIGQRIGVQTPHEDADIRDIIAPASLGNAAHIGSMNEGVKRCIQVLKRFPLAKVRGGISKTNPIHML